MSQVLQIIGALSILVAFIGVQRGAIAPRSRLSLVLNGFGSALLAWLAFAGHQWGFVLLETTWAVVSLAGLREQRWRR